MIHLVSRAAIAGLLLALAGCATAAYQPPQSGPTAEVALHRGALGQRENASLMIYDAGWENRADVYGGMGYTYDQPRSVPAGVAAHLEVELVRNTATTVQQCAHRVRFVPQAGHAYDVSPTGGCVAEVKDRATGRAPADLVVEPLPANWRAAN